MSLSRVLLSIKILSCITVSKFLIATGLTTGRYYGDQNYVTKSKILDFSEEKNFQCLDWIDYPMDAYRVSGGLVGNIAVICGEYECYKVIQNNTVLLGKMKSKRYGAASVVINNVILWIIGGRYNENYLSTTELLHLNGTVSEGNSGGRCSKMTNPTLSDPLNLKSAGRENLAKATLAACCYVLDRVRPAKP